MTERLKWSWDITMRETKTCLIKEQGLFLFSLHKHFLLLISAYILKTYSDLFHWNVITSGYKYIITITNNKNILWCLGNLTLLYFSSIFFLSSLLESVFFICLFLIAYMSLLSKGWFLNGSYEYFIIKNLTLKILQCSKTHLFTPFV